MSEEKEYRINGFDQMKAFYRFVFNTDEHVKSQHVSMYMFLLNQNNRVNWAKWFELSYDLGKYGSRIGSKKTYYQVLTDLAEWGFILYEKGINDFKSPRISIIPAVRKQTAMGTTAVPQVIPLPIPLPIPQPYPNSNSKPITLNEVGGKPQNPKHQRNIIPPEKQWVTDYLIERKVRHFTAEKFINFYSSKGWMIGKNKMKDWQAAVRTWEEKDRESDKPAPPNEIEW